MALYDNHTTCQCLPALANSSRSPVFDAFCISRPIEYPVAVAYDYLQPRRWQTTVHPSNHDTHEESRWGLSMNSCMKYLQLSKYASQSQEESRLERGYRLVRLRPGIPSLFSTNGHGMTSNFLVFNFAFDSNAILDASERCRGQIMDCIVSEEL